MAEQRPIAYMHDMAASTVISPDDIDQSFDGSVLDLLRSKLSVQIAYGESNVVAINAGPSLAEKLEVNAGQALLLMEEALVDQEGRVVEHSLNYFVPEYFQFLIVRR
jgi:DNA-binding GntR family transcriptional regulator